MSDPRTDFFASAGQPDQGSGDERTAFFASNGKGISDSSSTAPTPLDTGDLFGSMGKYVVGSVAHAAGNLADIVTGTAPGPESHAERWSSPFAITNRLGQLDPDQQRLHEGVGSGYDTLFGTGPAATEVKTRIPQAIEGISTVVPFLRGVAGEAAATEAASSMDRPQSISAAAASPNVVKASPELQAAIQEVKERTGGNVNSDAMSRQVEADSLPVPIKLTKGQALQDPARISQEQNMRGQQADLATRFNEQNGQLVQNLHAIRDHVGPDVFTTNPVEHGDTLIEAYKAKAAKAEADINAKYQALRDANGGQFPVDGKQLFSNVTDALHKQLLFEHAPQLGTLSRLADQGMTFEQFEALRTNLATIARSSSDGLERRAASVMRDEMEKLPLSGSAANLKPLADAARSAARTQFQALEADPAYKAAVNDSVSPDRFVQKFIVNGTRDGVAKMRDNLGDNPTASQTMSVAALDHLRRSAGIDDLGNGNFSQANFNKNLQALSPKFPSLFEHGARDQLETLGNVARYTQFQPRGSFVNNSNTFTAAAAEHAKDALEGAVNVAAHGVPVGTWVRKGLQGKAARDFVRESLRPGAGIEEVSPP